MSVLEQVKHIRNILELFCWRREQTPDAAALKHKRDGKWRVISYREWHTSVILLADVLRGYLKQGDSVALISNNRPEWTYVDLATMSCGGIVAPLYPNSISRDIRYIVNDCKAKIVFVANMEQLSKIRQLKDRKEIPSVSLIVTFDNVSSLREGEMTLSELMLTGRIAQRHVFSENAAAIDPATVMTVIYTSGTTGNPKGVMLTHHNILSNVRAAVETIGEEYLHEGCLLSFLPLCHALERTCGYYLPLSAGLTIAYAEGIPQLLQNFREIKPTILVSVPRIYEKIYGGMMERADTPVKKQILQWALGIGRQKAFHEVEGKPVDLLFPLKYALAHKLVFSKLHEGLGGRFRFAACGGAPLSKEIAIFLRGADILVIEGYGMTETSPIMTLNKPEAMKFGSVGQALPGVEIRLEPDPEGHQGMEIYVRGPNIMKGYYKKEAETAAVLSEDGWLSTGDVGYLDQDNFLFITDRKKELLKTSGGKFVAPAPIENRFRDHPLVEQACIVGNERKYCIALIYPNLSMLEKELGRKVSGTMEELMKDETIINVYKEILEQVNRDLNRWEQIKKFTFLPNELTIEQGELTPTMKMKRRIIDERYKQLIDALYA